MGRMIFHRVKKGMCLWFVLSCWLLSPWQANAGNGSSQTSRSVAPAYSDTLIFGYSDNKMSLNLGLGMEVGIQGGIRLPEELMARLKGNRITEIWFAVGKTPTRQENYVFISKELGFTDFDCKQTVEKVDSGWNQVKLEKPFEITGENLYVGFRMVSSGEVFSMDGRADNDLVNFIRLTQKEDDPTCSWQHQSGGNINIYVVVQGSNLPQNDLAIESIMTKPYAKANDEKPVKIWVRNRGAADIHDIEAKVYIDGNLDRQFEVNGLNIGKNQLSLLALGSVAMGTSGLHDLKVVVTKVNGASDDNELDNAQWKENIICKKEYSDRKVLLEHFSTMKCVNCPSAHLTIEDALFYREDVIHVVHHSAYGSDPLTIDASNDFTFFYSNGSQSSVYAPGCMLDRTNMSKYGATDGAESTLGPAFFPQRATFGKLVDESLSRPAYVTVDITPSYDRETRKLTVEVSGGLPGGDADKYLKGSDIRLNIFLTEDSIVGYQAGASHPQHYIHNAAIRQVMTPVWGDRIEFNGAGYKSKEYQCILPDAWMPRQMHIIAFLSHYNPSNPNNCEVFNANIADMSHLTASGIEELWHEEESGNVRVVGSNLWLNGASSAYRIYNLNGEQVAGGAGHKGAIDLSGLPKGVYVCKIATRSGINVIKLSI